MYILVLACGHALHTLYIDALGSGQGFALLDQLQATAARSHRQKKPSA